MSKIGQLSAEIEYPEHVKFFVDTHGTNVFLHDEKVEREISFGL